MENTRRQITFFFNQYSCNKWIYSKCTATCHVLTSLSKSFWLTLHLDKRQETLALLPPMTPPPEHTVSCQMFCCAHKDTAEWTHRKLRHRGIHPASCCPVEFHSKSFLLTSTLQIKIHCHVQVTARLQLCGLKHAPHHPEMLHFSQMDEIQLS